MTDPAPALNEKALEAAMAVSDELSKNLPGALRNAFAEVGLEFLRAYIAALPAVSEPVAWRVKDHADGWILWRSKTHALLEARESGALVEPLYPASALAALQSRVTQLEDELAALKAALKPLSERAAKWKHNTDSARISVPLREIRAALQEAGHDKHA